MEIEVKLNGSERSLVINVPVDLKKCNCYKSSSTNKRKTLALIKVGMSKADSSKVISDHVEIFRKLVTSDSNYPLEGIFPEVCYPIRVTDANNGMIMEGDEKIWIELGAHHEG